MSEVSENLDLCTYVEVKISYPGAGPTDRDRARGRLVSRRRIVLSDEEVRLTASFVDPVRRSLLSAVDEVIEAYRDREIIDA